MRSGADPQPAVSLMRDEVESELIFHLRENFLPRNSELVVERDANLFDTGVLDSAGLLECIAFLERRFGIEIPDEDLLPENFSSIASTVGYLQARLQAPPKEIRT